MPSVALGVSTDLDWTNFELSMIFRSRADLKRAGVPAKCKTPDDCPGHWFECNLNEPLQTLPVKCIRGWIFHGIWGMTLGLRTLIEYNSQTYQVTVPLPTLH